MQTHSLNVSSVFFLLQSLIKKWTCTHTHTHIHTRVYVSENNFLIWSLLLPLGLVTGFNCPFGLFLHSNLKEKYYTIEKQKPTTCKSAPKVNKESIRVETTQRIQVRKWPARRRADRRSTLEHSASLFGCWWRGGVSRDGGKTEWRINVGAAGQVKWSMIVPQRHPQSDETRKDWPEGNISELFLAGFRCCRRITRRKNPPEATVCLHSVWLDPLSLQASATV